MSQIIGVLKEDAADVFDFTRKRGGGTKDLGVILQRMRNHYCDTLTFREQRNLVENMKQGTQESAADFLVRVSGAVESLARDFKGTIPKEELDTLLYDVSFNGVNEDVRHVLDSVMAQHGELDVDKMYDAVKTHEAYVVRNKRLRNRAPSAGTPSMQVSASLGGHFKPRFQRPTAWVAVAMEDLGPTPEGVEYCDEEGEDSSTKDSSNDSGGLYIPDFLGEAPDGNWGLNVRMAQAIKADEAQQKKCFVCQSPDHFIRDCPSCKKWQEAPAAEGATQKQSGHCNAKGEGTVLSARSAGAGGLISGTSTKRSGKIKKGTQRVTHLNPDPFKRFIGPKNWGEAIIDGELVTCLLDNGAQLNFMTPAYAEKRNLDVYSLERLAQEIGGPLPPIRGIGGILVEPTGFAMVNIQVPCVKGYNEEQIVIVLDDPSMEECPVILGTPTLYRVMQVIKESEITKLATPWAMSRFSWLARGLAARVAHTTRNNMANKAITPACVDEVVRVYHKIQLPPFGHKVIHGRTNLKLIGYQLNVMTHDLEKRLPHLPLGVEVLSAYATITTGNNKVAVVLKNTTNDWVEIDKGVPIARMVTANQIPPATIEVAMGDTPEKRALTEKERHEELFKKLDLSGLDKWDQDLAEKLAVSWQSTMTSFHWRNMR